MIRFICFLLVTLLFSQTHNGKLFDPGVAMTKKFETAPKELDDMISYLGNYKVTKEVLSGDKWIKNSGFASISFFNRGSGYMERYSFDETSNEGLKHEQMALLTYAPAQKVWNYGIVDNISENIVLYDGLVSNDSLILYQGIRKAGGPLHSILRLKRFRTTKNSFKVTLEESNDYSRSFTLIEKRSFTKINTMDKSLYVRDDYGKPFEGRQKESAEFDFLLGENDANHELTFPNGQVAKFPTTTSAVYVLGGNAIMEFNWFDLDKSNPNNATTIIRIYNRATRQWESLYTSNRAHSQLFFGGKKEGDDIVLTIFDTHANTSRMNYFVFHNIKERSYDWYSHLSVDRGKNFTKNWTISVKKR